jgi:cytochrome c oxidase subunit I+III
MAIGFALVIVDIVANMALAVRGSRNPWRAGSLEWAMPTPPARLQLREPAARDGRDPLSADPGIAVRIARGEGFLGTPRAAGARS